ncbi:MAG TPA: BON domain-containing protein [Verrucomicrobiae bacterium]|nr:BON domain-containing protein [Verrucomicrobiae bacterium]
MAQGKSDAEVTQIIVGAIMRDNLDNALAVKNLKITAANGRVTLSGKVKNAGQKQQILAAAETVVGPGNLDNQLETR